MSETIKQCMGFLGEIFFQSYVGDFHVATCRSKGEALKSIDEYHAWHVKRDAMPEWEKIGIPEEDYEEFIQWKKENHK